MKPLVVIPARGGSKGIPRKNIKELGKKPLIQYTIEAAREVFDDTVICVSTDDVEIKNVVENMGLSVPFIRPEYLATDHAGSHEVLIHAVEFYESKNYFPDTIILLQATSPFRTGQHVQEALRTYNPLIEMVVSVKETKSNPYYILREVNEDGWLVKSKDGGFVRRQDCPKVYELNGAIYVINVNALKSKQLHQMKFVKHYEMDEVSSHDIDTPLDWLIAEALIQGNNL